MLHYHKKSPKMLHYDLHYWSSRWRRTSREPFLNSRRSNHGRTIHSVKNLKKNWLIWQQQQGNRKEINKQKKPEDLYILSLKLPENQNWSELKFSELGDIQRLQNY